MQDALLALQKYWTDRGCLVMQPFNTEVGAGTANPATTLRVLGPEPWHVGYVEPSVRPDDSRYGENPNRLQTHTQFQVILKPDPGNPQELYLGSLAALGIDIRANDIRFVEDNWAQPALGSWGLGWEVWLNGLEISQFTYFQQVGGITLDPVSVEITYGVERIMMALQGVAHFKDIKYSSTVSYGEIFGQAEYEMSRYYLDEADITANKQLFDTYAAEAQRMLEQKLPVPAYIYVLKCSHTFNVLDARGVISTTERAKAFATMRTLTRQAAQLWVQRRDELGYPLGVATTPKPAEITVALPVVNATSTLLFEIGVEEMPAAEVTRSATAVQNAMTEKLAATRLAHGQVHAYATPRRIVVLVDQVQPTEPDAVRTVRGPRTTAAFDEHGELTKAAQGFLRAQGAQASDLQRIQVDNVEYIGVTKTDVGRSAVAVLSELLGHVVSELRSDKNMRWSDPALSFTRPVRWIVALLGDTVVPVTVSTLRSNRITRVHRTASAPEVRVSSAEGYLDFLAKHDIIVDGTVRREEITAAANRLAGTIGGIVDFTAEADLLDEITNLVEQPNVILGSFAERYLELPSKILTTVMRKHQRYLPVRDKNGDLLPYFITVANGVCNPELVRAGNEAVLRARYEDAAFFWRADLEISLQQHKDGLAKLTFAEQLGSVADRAMRIADVAATLAEQVDLSAQDNVTLHRAGQLAKFDLASNMVIELSSLAGTMAQEYALRAGENPAVASALFEMELPRNAGDALPTTAPGALLALADRFDLLAGLFGIGANPTGSSDPFGLRRAAIGVIAIMRDFPSLDRITLSSGLAAAAQRFAAQGIEISGERLDEAHEFIVRRYEQQLLDANCEHRIVQAILPLADTPIHADETLTELEKCAQDPTFLDLVAAVQRVHRIVPEGNSPNYVADLLREPAEIALHRSVQAVATQLGDNKLGLAEFIPIATALIEPITVFFTDVLVMADDQQLRAARLGLLASIAQLTAGIMDWAAL